jgi:hypothetical protein
MNSLKQFIPVLSDIFVNLSENALYERQRALVRVGLLKPIAGRGPGSGVPLTPESVAMLLIAVLATDNLNETGAATKAVVAAKRVPLLSSKHVLVGADNLHALLSRTLSSDDDSDRILTVRVQRLTSSATVFAKAVHQPILFLPEKNPGGGNFSVDAQFHGDTFFELRRLLAKTEPLTDKKRQLLQRRLARLQAFQDKEPRS